LCSQDEDYTQLSNQIIKEADDDRLMKYSYQHKEMMIDETRKSHGFEINHRCVYASYEGRHKENEGIENQHPKIMLRDYDEELRLLEEWLIGPKLQ
jgi:hypothetical protein